MNARIILVALLVGAAAEVALSVTLFGWLVTLAAVAGTAAATVVLAVLGYALRTEGCDPFGLRIGRDIARAAVAPDEETGLLDRKEQAILARLAKVRDEAKAAVVEPVLALHRPWYEVGGVRRDFTVLAYGSDVPTDHVCRIGPEHERCITYDGSPDDTEHQVLACSECRQTTEDGEVGHPFWPCPTVRAVESTDAPAALARVKAEALREAADAIQALHPGETKNSVIFLRDRADRIEAEAGDPS